MHKLEHGTWTKHVNEMDGHRDVIIKYAENEQKSEREREREANGEKDQ